MQFGGIPVYRYIPHCTQNGSSHEQRNLALDLQCRNDHLSHLVHLVWLWWLAEELCQQVPSGHVLVVRPGPGPPNQQVLRWVHNEALQPSSLWSSRRSGAQRQGPPSAEFPVGCLSCLVHPRFPNARIARFRNVTSETVARGESSPPKIMMTSSM